MNDIIRKHIGIETPKEMDQAVDRLAGQLAEMDRTEGVFGEALLDDELEIGGGAPISAQPFYCQYCKTYGFHDCTYGRVSRL